MKLIFAALFFASAAAAQDADLACSGWQASVLGVAKVNFEASKALEALEGAQESPEVTEARERIVRAMVEIKDIQKDSDALRASLCPTR